MKKIFFLSLLSAALITTSANAQGPNAPQQKSAADQQAVLLQQAKDQQVPPMVEKTGLTTAQCTRIVEINFEIRQQAATVLQGLSDADRSAKIAELKAEKEKRYAAIPLTPEQIKTVYAYYEDMGKNMQKKN